MIHLDIVDCKEINLELHVFYGMDGGVLDIWVFDTTEDDDRFAGHLTNEMFQILMEEDLGKNRNAFLAALTTCDSHPAT